MLNLERNDFYWVLLVLVSSYRLNILLFVFTYHLDPIFISLTGFKVIFWELFLSYLANLLMLRWYVVQYRIQSISTFDTELIVTENSSKGNILLFAFPFLEVLLYICFKNKYL